MVTLSFCLLPVRILAQTGDVDVYVREHMIMQRIPGLALTILKNGEVVKLNGYGFANLEHRIPVVPETIFQSGSVGKQFTATAVMILVEDGKITLDERISKYLNNIPKSWSRITVRHLLAHTSGMIFSPDALDFSRDYTEDELLKLAARVPLASQPGEKWSYSNLGYVVLGIIISKVTGKFYGDFIQERIFKPLGMNTARIISEADIIPNRAAGYRLVDGELKNQEWVSPTLNTTADGSLYLTAIDMAKWDAALYGEKILKKSSLDQMWAAVRLNNGKTHPHGFGWFLHEARGHKLIEHGGQWQGFTSHIARYADDKLTVIVLTNLASADLEAIAHGVATLYLPDLRPRAIKLDPNLLDAYVGQYKLTPDLVITISREQGTLFFQATGQPRIVLLAETETTFFIQGADLQFIFVKDGNGAATRLTWRKFGNIVEAKKVK